MKYLKYYMLVAALVSVFIELSATRFSKFDPYNLGLTVAPFLIIYITMSCGTSCRSVGRVTRYSRLTRK